MNDQNPGRVEAALRSLLASSLRTGDAIHYPGAAWEAADALGILPTDPSDSAYYTTSCALNAVPHRHLVITEDNGPRFFR